MPGRHKRLAPATLQKCTGEQHTAPGYACGATLTEPDAGWHSSDVTCPECIALMAINLNHRITKNQQILVAGKAKPRPVRPPTAVPEILLRDYDAPPRYIKVATLFNFMMSDGATYKSFMSASHGSQRAVAAGRTKWLGDQASTRYREEFQPECEIIKVSHLEAAQMLYGEEMLYHIRENEWHAAPTF